MLDKKTTIRKAAAKFGISKSTAHSDLTVILPEIDRALYEEVRKLLDLNWNERYYRGGRATKRKYAGQCKINLVSAIATLNKSSQREASV